MILLDTNIIVDLFGDGGSSEAQWSQQAYANHAGGVQLACNIVVVAELAAQAPSRPWLLAELEAFRIDIVDMTMDGAFAAGTAHAAYRQRGGSRDAILADFLIAGHASALSVPFMTRDRRLATYFPDLTLITPETYP